VYMYVCDVGLALWADSTTPSSVTTLTGFWSKSPGQGFVTSPLLPDH